MDLRTGWIEGEGGADLTGLAVAQGIAQGFPGNLQQTHGLVGRKGVRRRGIDVETPIHTLWSTQLVGYTLQGSPEFTPFKGFRLQTFNKGPDVANDRVEIPSRPLQALLSLLRLRFHKMADLAESQSHRVDALDDAVVEVASDPNPFFETVSQTMFTLAKGILGLALSGDIPGHPPELNGPPRKGLTSEIQPPHHSPIGRGHQRDFPVDHVLALPQLP